MNDGVYRTGREAVNALLATPGAALVCVTDRCRQHFRCDPQTAGRTFRPSQTPVAKDQTRRGPAPIRSPWRAPRAVLHRGLECCERHQPLSEHFGA